MQLGTTGIVNTYQNDRRWSIYTTETTFGEKNKCIRPHEYNNRYLFKVFLRSADYFIVWSVTRHVCCDYRWNAAVSALSRIPSREGRTRRVNSNTFTTIWQVGCFQTSITALYTLCIIVAAVVLVFLKKNTCLSANVFFPGENRDYRRSGTPYCEDNASCESSISANAVHAA